MIVISMRSAQSFIRRCPFTSNFYNTHACGIKPKQHTTLDHKQMITYRTFPSHKQTTTTATSHTHKTDCICVEICCVRRSLPADVVVSSLPCNNIYIYLMPSMTPHKLFLLRSQLTVVFFLATLLNNSLLLSHICLCECVCV